MILVCAATGTEAAACRAGISDAGASGVEVLTTGVGPGRAADALRRWLAGHPPVPAEQSAAGDEPPTVRPRGGARPEPSTRDEPPGSGRPEPFDSGVARDASAQDRLRAADHASHSVHPERSAAESKGATLIVSSGFAGALTPGIDALSWVTASALYRLVDGRPIRVALPAGLLRVAHGALACAVVSADHVVTPPVPGLAGPAAGDMESAALGEIAGAAGLPFVVLRLVTDTPARPLPRAVHGLSAALAAHGVAARLAHGSRAALDAARSPARTAAFVRDAFAWRERLRARWREQARSGVRSSPPGA